MKGYVIRTVVRSTDEVRVKKYLEKNGIEYSESVGVLGTNFIRFKANKSGWKRIKKDLNLFVEEVYCSFKELRA